MQLLSKSHIESDFHNFWQHNPTGSSRSKKIIQTVKRLELNLNFWTFQQTSTVLTPTMKTFQSMDGLELILIKSYLLLYPYCVLYPSDADIEAQNFKTPQEGTEKKASWLSYFPSHSTRFLKITSHLINRKNLSQAHKEEYIFFSVYPQGINFYVYSYTLFEGNFFHNLNLSHLDINKFNVSPDKLSLLHIYVLSVVFLFSVRNFHFPLF
jgi:hypothetical protein